MSEHISVAYPWAPNLQALKDMVGWIPNVNELSNGAAQPPADPPTEIK